jgi:bacteriocin biosynthesis cyclodehydratase domain-containing protein
MISDTEHEARIRAMLADPNLRVPKMPRLVPDVSIFHMPDGLGVQVRGAETPVMVRGRQADAAMEFLLQALDGTRTVAHLLEECPPNVSRGALLQTLLLLHFKGLLIRPEASVQERTGAADEGMRRQLLFWGRKLGVTLSAASAGEIQRRLETSRLVLVGTGLFGAATYDVLVRSGCGWIDVIAWDDSGMMLETLASGPAPPAQAVRLPSTSVDDALAAVRGLARDVDLIVTATRNAPADLFHAINRLSLAQGCPWLRANDDGTQFEIGPYVRPYGSACFRCMDLRQASTQSFAIEEHLYEQHLARQRPAGETPPFGEAVPVAVLGASLVAGEVVRILTNVAAPTLVNAVLTVNPLNGSFETNAILRVPRCPDCSRGAVSFPIEAGSRG